MYKLLIKLAIVKIIVIAIIFTIAQIDTYFNPRTQTQHSYECSCDYCEEGREEEMREYYDDVRGGHFERY